MQEQIRRVIAAHGRLPVDALEVPANADLYALGFTSHASVNGCSRWKMNSMSSSPTRC